MKSTSEERTGLIYLYIQGAQNTEVTGKYCWTEVGNWERKATEDALGGRKKGRKGAFVVLGPFLPLKGWGGRAERRRGLGRRGSCSFFLCCKDPWVLLGISPSPTPIITRSSIKPAVALVRDSSVLTRKCHWVCIHIRRWTDIETDTIC